VNEISLLSPRQQRAKETRSRLFTAAAELFDAQGYHQTTVDQIVKRASVAKGTFFLHFATKDAVIAELLRIQIDSVKKTREELAGASPIQRLRATLRVLATMSSISRPITRAVMMAALANPDICEMTHSLHRAVFDYVVKDAQDAQTAGEITNDTPPEKIAEVLTSTCLGVALSFMLMPGPAPLLETLEPVLEANLAAFAVANKSEETSDSP
jgi:AcrR family transcriptional regulator